jgi:hypothetical protein
VITHGIAVLGALTFALAASSPGISHATLVPRTVLAEEFGYLT